MGGERATARKKERDAETLSAGHLDDELGDLSNECTVSGIVSNKVAGQGQCRKA